MHAWSSHTPIHVPHIISVTLSWALIRDSLKTIIEKISISQFYRCALLWVTAQGRCKQNTYFDTFFRKACWAITITTVLMGKKQTKRIDRDARKKAFPFVLENFKQKEYCCIFSRPIYFVLISKKNVNFLNSNFASHKKGYNCNFFQYRRKSFTRIRIQRPYDFCSRNIFASRNYKPKRNIETPIFNWERLIHFLNWNHPRTIRIFNIYFQFQLKNWINTRLSL